jgi:tRNA nucleotidyltransferase (CCA-adding enzyme)
MLDRLHKLTILKAIHPDLLWDDTLQSLVECLPGKEPPKEWDIEKDSAGLNINQALCYAILLMRSPVVDDVCKRLRLVRPLSEIIKQAAQLRNRLKDLTASSPSQVTRDLDRISNLAVYAVYLDSNQPKLKGILSRYLSSWQYVESNITGKDLQEAGLEPGPMYTEILSKLRNAWLDGEISSKKQENALLNELIATLTDDKPEE